MQNRLKNCLFIGLAFFFTGLGAIGVILPILPTTPFLLVATYFFAKGSEKFHKWFLSTRLYKNHLDDFVRTRSMTLKTKWCILLPVSAMLTVGFILSPVWYARAPIIIVMIAKYVYFFTKIKTIPPEEKNKRKIMEPEV